MEVTTRYGGIGQFENGDIKINATVFVLWSGGIGTKAGATLYMFYI